MPSKRKPKLAVWKFTSCDGCQLNLLDCENELLQIAERVEISYFLEATKHVSRGPYDLSIVEGSVSTPEEIKRIEEVRKKSRYLVTIGACAATGGIQALKNFRNTPEFVSIVYANPSYIDTLDTSQPISDYVHVDFSLQGCPISKKQLLEVISSFLQGRKPNIPTHSVCIECKERGNACIMITKGAPCLGPVTLAGCGALCPSYNRACYGCFGPMETPNLEALALKLKSLGQSDEELRRVFQTFNVNCPEFSRISKLYE